MGREPDKLNISAGQRRVTEFLSSLGLVVESEVKIGSYRVDCYLRELKVVVEFDGPFMHHSTKQNSRRDEELLNSGVKEVIHVRGTSKAELEELEGKLGL